MARDKKLVFKIDRIPDDCKSNKIFVKQMRITPTNFTAFISSLLNITEAEFPQSADVKIIQLKKENETKYILCVSGKTMTGIVDYKEYIDYATTSEIVKHNLLSICEKIVYQVKKGKLVFEFNEYLIPANTGLITLTIEHEEINEKTLNKIFKIIGEDFKLKTKDITQDPFYKKCEEGRSIY